MQGQFVLETYFVMVIYGLIVCGNIMLIEAGDSKGEVSEIELVGAKRVLKCQYVLNSQDQKKI